MTYQTYTMGTTKLTTARAMTAPSRMTQKHQLGMVTAMRQRMPRKMLNCRDGPTRGRGCARWSQWSGVHRCTVDLHTCIRGESILKIIENIRES